MTVREVARRHYRSRSLLVDAMVRLAALLWARVDPDRIADSWSALVPLLQTQLTTAQRNAAAGADAYLSEVLRAQNLSPDADGSLNIGALTGIASDGRELDVLLEQPALTALAAITRERERGATTDAAVRRAMASGQAAVEMIVGTQVADAGRVADGVALTARPAVTGYVRMLNPPGCSRCVQLAGRWYRWNAAFNRHPNCKCVAVPAAENSPGDIRTDPKAYFESLSMAEQDRIFTKAGAESIRLGANLNQVVNARRSAAGLSPAGGRLTPAELQKLSSGRLEAVDVFGRPLLITREGVTVRGLAGQRLGAREGIRTPGDRYRSAKTPRLMPESILQIAGNDRDEAVRLLKRFGYIL